MTAAGVPPPAPGSSDASLDTLVARYASPVRRARAAGTVLLLLAAFGVLGAIIGAVQYDLLDSLNSGEDVADEAIDAFDVLYPLARLLQGLLLLVGALTFIMWLWRAYGNLPVLGQRTLRRGRGWTIGAWFVPLLNLVWPFQLVRDTWRASDPDGPREGVSDISRVSVSALLAWWWALWLLPRAVLLVATLSYRSAEGLDELQPATMVFVVADAVTVVAALLAWQVVRRTTRRQEARAAALLGGASAPAAG